MAIIKNFILVLLAVPFLCSDTGRSISQLLFNAAQVIYPPPYLFQAAKQGSGEAAERLIVYADEKAEPDWLLKLIELGNAHAAWIMVKHTNSENESRRWLKVAARGGVSQAQFQLAMEFDNGNEREKWLKKSADLQYKPAQIALADWYLLHHETEKAKLWLEKVALDDAKSAFQLGHLLWREGHYGEAKQFIAQAAQNDFDIAKRYDNALSQYTMHSLDTLEKANTWQQSDDCIQRIQLLATSLSSIEQAHRFYHQFRKDKRLQSLPICLSEPVWLKEEQLSCDENWQNQGRLGCDISSIESYARSRKFTHAVIFAEQGKANVNNGFMFLDVGDTYSVFVHELAHFAGFVDEYPMSRGLATIYCDRKDVPNLLFDGVLTYSPMSTLQMWAKYAEPVQIFPARACNNINQLSYKPTHGITFLENHDTNNIPPIYIALWKAQLANSSTHKTVAVNFFQYYEQQQNIEKAAYWLAQTSL